jgi:hypothetical protein
MTLEGDNDQAKAAISDAVNDVLKRIEPNMSEEMSSYPIEESEIICPVAMHFEAVMRSNEESLRALRRFRHSLMNCHVCYEFRNCEILEGFNLQIDSMIAEILEEWGW